MNGVQTRLKCKPNVKRCKRFVFAAHSPLLHPNTLKTKAIIHFQTDHILTRFVFPPLTASADGEVTEIFPKAGELVGTGAPIMNVARLNDMWVTFNVREDFLKDFTVGNEISAFIPAFDKEIKFKVTYMKDLGTYAAWKATKTTGQFDLKTFEVKAVPVERTDGLRPGMSAIIEK